MIKLYMFPPAFGLRNASPFCLKIEMALGFLGLEYEVETLGDPRKAPKGKLPYAEIGGEVVADSELIFERLDVMTDGRLFASLTSKEMAQGTAFTRLAEDHLYWLIVASRWLDDAWWPNVQSAFFGGLPGVVRAIVAPMARKQLRQAYYLHGLGRHSLEEQKHFVSKDLQAISDVVVDAGFIAGQRMSAFDFGVAAQVSSLLDNRPATWATTLAERLPPLRDYAERIQQRANVYGRERSVPSGGLR